MKRIALFLFCLWTTCAVAQSTAPPDSLLKKITSARDAKERLWGYLDLGQFWYERYSATGYSNALQCYIKADSIAEHLPDAYARMIANIRIARVYEAIGNDIPRAVFYYQKGLTLYKPEFETEHPGARVRCLIGLSHLLATIGQEKEALRYCDEIDQDESLKKDTNLAYSSNLATAHILAGTRYKTEFMKRFEVIKNFRNRFTADYEKRWYAESVICYYNEQKEYMKGLRAFQVWSNRIVSVGDSLQAYHHLSVQYEYLNQFDSALYCKKIETRLRKIFDVEKEKQAIEEQTIRFETRQKEYENESLKHAADHQQRIFKISLAIVILLLVLLTFALVLFVRNRNNVRMLEKQKIILEERDQEKTLYIREIHHRIKNNLQILSSILDIQQIKTDSPELRDKFREARSRIQSIALVHKNLYERDDFERVHVDTYFNTLLQMIYSSFMSKNKSLHYTIQTSDISFNTDTIIPLALIVNELFTNTIKYTLHEDVDIAVNLTLEAIEGQKYRLEYSDTGPGLPEGYRIENGKTLGHRMISLLVRQLDGTMDVQSVPGHLKFSITFRPSNP